MIPAVLPSDVADARAAASLLFDLVPCPVWIHEAATHRVLYSNPAARCRLGIGPGDEVEPLLRRAPDWRERTGGLGRGPLLRLERRGGDTLDVDLAAQPLHLEGRASWLVVANDLVERSAAAQALAAAEARYHSIFQNAVEGIFQTTPDGKYLDANPALARIYGYESPAELTESITDISRQLYVDPTRRDTFVRMMRERGAVEGFESQIMRKDGSMVWISECVRAVRSPQGELLYYEGTVVDITLRKVAEDRLRHEAAHDKLTGFLNRSAFMRHTAEALEDGARCAVLFIDFDRFKLINDSLGHLAGDEFLRAAAKRLLEAVRPGDTVARLGGDEFGILLRGVRSRECATQVADRIQSLLDQPFEVGSRRLFVTASIGIALADGEYERSEDLLRDADVAMYRAKERGRARRELFDAPMREQALEQLQLESDLRAAVERDEFVLHYQPLVDLETGRVTSFEALIRWNHPSRGLLYPGAFIAAAEDTGAILEIGAWVLRAACRQARQWEDELGSAAPISINLSSRQFLQPDFAEWVGEVLDATGIPGSRLKIEITETVLMENPERVARMLHGLRERGIRICLDDFGTGFSSLSYLQRFPIDELKIDRGFVALMGSQGANGAILKAILNLAESLQLDAVAEGVETEAQARKLRDLGCGFAQGHYFSPPLAPHLAAAFGGLAAE